MKRMSWVLLVGLIVSFFSLPKPVSAQGYFQQYGSQPWTTPIPVPGGYMDAANGNLHIEIPIASIAERGHVPFIAKLVYDSHIWTKAVVNQSVTWQPVNVGGQPTAWGGWRLVTSVGTGGGVNYVTGSGVCYTRVGNINVPHYYTTYGPFSWTAPDGHVVPFGGFQTNRGNTCTVASPSFDSIATDASGYHIYVTNYTSVVVYAPDGTQVFPNVKDTNGNFYSVPNSNGDVTDTRGQMPITTTVNGTTITYKVQSSQATPYTITVTTESIPVNTLFGQSGVTECSTNCTVTVVQSVALPDGQSYQFGYDQGATGMHFGTLTSMTLPTGGAVDYSHSIFQDAYGNRYLYLESCIVGGGTWSYVPAVVTTCGTTCSQKATVTQPSADQELYTFTMYNGAMWNTQAASYNGSVSSANLLQSTTIGYNTSNPPFIQPISYVTTVPVASGDLTKQVTLTYDTSNFGNVINRNEWNFYPGTLPSTPDRTFSYIYLPNTNDRNMVNKRSETKLISGNSTYSDTIVTYDSYGSNGLTAISNVFGHDDTNFGGNYTARGNPTSVSSSGLTTASLTYDTTGQVLTSQDSAGNTTTFSYSDCYLNDALPPTTYSPSAATNAFPTKITLAATGSINLCYYWGSGKPASAKDQNGATTASHFLDSMDRRTHVIPPLGWTEWAYSSNETEVDAYTGISDLNPSTNCTSCRHDAAYLDSLGRVSASKLLSDPDGATIASSITYDSNRRIQTSANPYRSISDPTYGVETPSYDGLNRVTQLQHADNNVAKVYYGPAVSTVTGANTTELCVTTYGYGYPSLYVDEAGKMRETWTDGFGRTIEVDEPDSTGKLTSSTCYAYYPTDTLYQVNHTIGSQTQSRVYSYDLLSRLTLAVAPESGSVTYSYTKSGGGFCSGNPSAVCWQKDGRSITTTYSYDSLNRLTQKSYSDTTPTVTYVYDQTSANGLTITNGLGRLTSMTDGSGATAWSYDADGRIVAERRTIGTVTKTVSYAYNGDGSLASVTYPSGRTVNYAVGNAERAVSATDANGAQYAVVASYAATGGLSSVIYGKVTGGFNGMTETASYNNRLDLASIAASSSAGTALSLGYCFYTWVSGACQTAGSNNGSVTTIGNNSDTGRTETFAYDPLNRIASATTQATSGADCWGQSFAADPLANLTTINSTQTGCSIGTLSVTPSTTTNRLSFTPAPSYDQAGNMTGDGSYTYTFDAENRITSANGVNYGYDGNSLRVQKSSGTLYWRALTGDVLVETDANGNTKNEYIYFAGQRIAWWDASGNSYYIYSDALGSTRTIMEMKTVGGQMTPVTCYDADFTPYGQEVQHTNNCPSAYNYKFTGYERDTETGLDYAFARYYSSRLGRFMSPDPLGGGIGDPQSLNRYAYVGNNPTNFTDLLGLKKGNCQPILLESPNFSGCPWSYGSLGIYEWSNWDWYQNEAGWNLGTLTVGVLDYVTTNGSPNRGGPCTLNIRVNNKANLPPIEIGRIENQIAALFGDAVNANFFNTSGPYFTLDIVNASPGNVLFGQGVPATIYPNNISTSFSAANLSFRTMGTIMGTIGGHELVHSITGILDLPFNAANPTDLMSVDAITAMDAKNGTFNGFNLLVGNGLQLTATELQALKQACLNSQNKR